MGICSYPMWIFLCISYEFNSHEGETAEPDKTDELREEEELQLAIALSKSEAENKEKEKLRVTSNMLGPSWKSEPEPSPIKEPSKFLFCRFSKQYPLPIFSRL